jgi:hypothetical protein
MLLGNYGPVSMLVCISRQGLHGWNCFCWIEPNYLCWIAPVISSLDISCVPVIISVVLSLIYMVHAAKINIWKATKMVHFLGNQMHFIPFHLRHIGTQIHFIAFQIHKYTDAFHCISHTSLFQHIQKDASNSCLICSIACSGETTGLLHRAELLMCFLQIGSVSHQVQAARHLFNHRVAAYAP